MSEATVGCGFAAAGGGTGAEVEADGAVGWAKGEPQAAQKRAVSTAC